MDVYIDPKFSNDVSTRLIYLYVGMSPYAQLVADRVNIYCVTNDVMDYVCPPEARRYIDPECLESMKEKIKELIDNLPEEILKTKSIDEALDKIWGIISECRTWWGIEVSRACYRNLSASEAQELEKSGVPAKTGPSIFLAIDRIKASATNISKKINTQSKKTFSGVLALSLIHETFHACTDANGKKYSNEIWHVIIEESLATYMEYLYVKRSFIPIFIADTEDQPFEYRAWEYWRIHAPSRILCNIISHCWARDSMIPAYIPVLPIWYLADVMPVRLRYRVYYWDLFHAFFADLDPKWHRLFHEVIWSMLRTSPQKLVTFLWKIIALCIIKYMLRI